MKTHQFPTSVCILLVILTSCHSLSTEHEAVATTASQVDNQLVAATSTSTESNQEPSLVFFISKPGRFEVWLPSSTDVQEATIKKTIFQETLECPSIFYSLNSAYATVRYCDLVPHSIASLSSSEILEQARDELMSDLHVEIDTQQEELAQNTYPSLVLSGPVNMRGGGNDGTFKARILLAKNRIYLVAMSNYHEDWCNCLNQVNQVVDSLSVEPAP